MDNLIKVKIKSVYRSGKDDLLKDFYLPVLQTAKYYDRAVGFFSTSLLSYALKGISSIVRNDGKMRLIVGHPLEIDEFEALKEGYELHSISQIINKELDKIINEATSKVEKIRLNLFMLLVATNRLELKFAFKPRGMYHEKIGIVKDRFNNKILFHGSANETTNAINPDLNYESITVFKNWEEARYKDYAHEFEQGFEDLWLGNDTNIVTVDMPSKTYEKIAKSYMEQAKAIEDYKYDELSAISEITYSKQNFYPEIPNTINGKKFKIFDHQQDALKQWFGNSKKGLFQLATGSGKTITAMYGVSMIFDKATRPRKMLFIVAVPYVTLAEQWVKELSLFNMKPIKCYDSKFKWEDKLSNSISRLQSGEIEFMSVVVVNRTLSSTRFNSLISRVNKESIFFVGDECHHHASENIASFLPKANFKMGLSATPYIDKHEIEFDDEPNEEKEILINYYGNIIAEYSLAKALANDILTPYKYYIIIVVLTIDESEYYCDLSREIGRLMSIDKSKNNTALSNTVRKRNKIISNTENKNIILGKLLKKEKIEDKLHTLFYVGEGSSVIDETASVIIEKDLSQLELTAEVIMKDDWKLSKFTSLESPSDRKRIMDSFVDGSIDALVSMRVLDEGIDIPQCKRAFILASSRNSRQFIQRRGRILRKAKDKNFASIYDFVVLPNREVNGSNYFRTLVSRELKRTMDFVRLSYNRKECEVVAQQIADEYDIDLREL